MSRGPVDQLLDRLASLERVLTADLAEADRLARLPDSVVRALIEQELFRLWIPKSCGGLELDLPDALRVYEAAAAIDGSVGWAVMIGSGGGLFAAYLDAQTAREMFCRPDAVIAGSGMPQGKAERVNGGYRVTGRWRYASGAHYATTFTAACVVTRDDEPVLDDSGNSVVRAMAFEPSDVRILPTWDTTGMRGTGSHDFEVTDVFVPERRTFSVFTDAPRESGPLYRLPFGVLTELPVTAVALGIARHALAAFAKLAREKTSSGSNATLAADPAVCRQYASSLATVQLMKAGIDSLARQTWDEALAAHALARNRLAEITAQCVAAVESLQSAVGELVALAGMSGIRQDGEFSRAWRDLQALAAHLSVSPRHFVQAGHVLLE